MLAPSIGKSGEIALKYPRERSLYAGRVRLVPLLLVCWCLPAMAWNATGHKNTAEIAYNLLVPERQQYVTEILRKHPRFEEDFAAHMPEGIAASSDDVQALWIFQQASVWSDIIRGLDGPASDEYDRFLWHFINMPIYLEDSDEAALAGSLDHNMSMEFSPPLRQNLNSVQALKGNIAVWNSAKSSDAEKAVALCWILHIVGDMHQPLHNVALFSKAWYPQGDRGGNSIRVAWEPETKNLHAVWDEMPDRFEDLEPSDLTRDLLRSDAATVSSIEYWLRRHEQLARVFVYTDDVREQLLTGFAKSEFPAIELSEFYLDNAALLAKEQVILAGHRIAGLVE